MNIALFGGTFDPVHSGHLALARAAADRFDLGRVFFVPNLIPPHKQKQPLSHFSHRYAMLALATAEEKDFVPSLLEAPCETAETSKAKVKNTPAPSYSIDTVRRLKQTLRKADRLFFLIGLDAFCDVAKWHQAEALFRECAFIVASRPGFSLADVANSLPASLRPSPAATKPFAKIPATGDIILPGVTVHLLDGLNFSVSSTAIRDAVFKNKPLGKLVPASVAAYIKKEGLYRSPK